ncbi:MAG TPA: hypothetical protein PLF48_06200 [Chitinophagales bacterium]|nr:hypothetical protein [Chitinophagales bacterium]
MLKNESMKTTYSILVCCLLLFSCNAHSQDTVQRGKLYNARTLEVNPKLSYALYIPQKENYSKRIAYFFFDPSGDGSYPLKIYQSIADSLGVVLIGNNASKNGMSFNAIAENFAAISTEVLRKLEINKDNMCLWGFSGGAKAAMYCADNFDYHYAIYGGAVYPEMQHQLDLLGINGKKDMNYTELLAYDISQQNNTNHLQIEWEGKHSWPDSLTATDAFKWFLFRKMQKNEIKWDAKLIQKTNIAFVKNVNQLYKTKQYYKTYINGKKTIIMLDKLSNVQPVKNIIGTVVKSQSFLNEMKQLENQYQKETKLKNQYIANLQTQDSLYWKTETNKLYALANTDKYGIYERLLGFLSLAAYSVSTESFRQNKLDNLPNILALYRYADPQNAEYAFLSAKYYLLKNDIIQAKAYKQVALNLGMDTSRFTQDELLSKLP